MEVRRIEAGDGIRLRALRLAALRDAPWAFGSTAEREAGYAARHWEMLAGGPGAVFVGGDWEGMAGVYLDGDEPRLWGMWVAPSARGRGLGRDLVEAVAGWARDRALPPAAAGRHGCRGGCLPALRAPGFRAHGGVAAAALGPGVVRARAGAGARAAGPARRRRPARAAAVRGPRPRGVARHALARGHVALAL